MIFRLPVALAMVSLIAGLSPQADGRGRFGDLSYTWKVQQMSTVYVFDGPLGRIVQNRAQGDLLMGAIRHVLATHFNVEKEQIGRPTPRGPFLTFTTLDDKATFDVMVIAERDGHVYGFGVHQRRR